MRKLNSRKVNSRVKLERWFREDFFRLKTGRQGKTKTSKGVENQSKWRG